MKNLILIPTKRELAAFKQKTEADGLEQKKLALGAYEALEFPEIGMVVARGGLGKVQFGVQTQYFINRLPHLETVVCAGAAGSLFDDTAVGDIVVATETIEHDIRSHFGEVMPRFEPAPSIIRRFRSLNNKQRVFSIHFGPVASGDEDIMSDQRKIELRKQTGAVAVAWEGAGGARACRFSKIPFVEVRAISDSADDNAGEDIFKNLDKAMGHLAELLVEWSQS